MKKTCFVLLCALLLGFAPGAIADDGSVFDDLLDQLVALFSGLGDEPEYGPEFPPGGQPAAGGTSGSDDLPPNNSPATETGPEYGPAFPPGG